MSWLATLPIAMDGMPYAVEATYREWLRQERDEARRWLRGKEYSVALEPAISVYALDTVLEDPPTALEWAEKLQDQTLRHETLEKLARAWVSKDADAARSWVEQSELSEAAARRILEPRKSRRAGRVRPSGREQIEGGPDGR